MVLIGLGIWHAGWHIWLPNPADQEEVWFGNCYIFAGCALSLVAAVWSGARENRVWVTVCVGLPGGSGGLGGSGFPVRPEAVRGRRGGVPDGAGRNR